VIILDKYGYENRQERILRIIRENKGLGFNELNKICSEICSRQTLHNEIKRLIEEGDIIEMPYGKQGKRFYPFEPQIEMDKNHSKTLEDSLKIQKSSWDVLSNGLYKMGSFEKMAVMSMLYNNLNSLSLKATYFDTLVTADALTDDHDLYQKVLAKINNFRQKIVETTLYFEDGTGDPAEFMRLFLEYSIRQRKKNNIKLLSYIPTKHKKIWKKNWLMLLQKRLRIKNF